MNFIALSSYFLNKLLLFFFKSFFLQKQRLLVLSWNWSSIAERHWSIAWSIATSESLWRAIDKFSDSFYNRFGSWWSIYTLVFLIHSFQFHCDLIRVLSFSPNLLIEGGVFVMSFGYFLRWIQFQSNNLKLVDFVVWFIAWRFLICNWYIYSSFPKNNPLGRFDKVLFRVCSFKLRYKESLL